MKQGKCAQWHNGLTCVHWSIKPLGEGCWGCGCRGWIEFNIPLVTGTERIAHCLWLNVELCTLFVIELRAVHISWLSKSFVVGNAFAGLLHSSCLEPPQKRQKLGLFLNDFSNKSIVKAQSNLSHNQIIGKKRIPLLFQTQKIHCKPKEVQERLLAKGQTKHISRIQEKEKVSRWMGKGILDILKQNFPVHQPVIQKEVLKLESQITTQISLERWGETYNFILLRKLNFHWILGWMESGHSLIAVFGGAKFTVKSAREMFNPHQRTVEMEESKMFVSVLFGCAMKLYSVFLPWEKRSKKYCTLVASVETNR